MKYLVFFLVFLVPSVAVAQVNAEAFRPNKAGQGFSTQLDLAFGLQTGNIKQTSWNSDLRLDYLSEEKSKLGGTNHHVFLVGSWGKGEASGKPYRDSYFGHARWVHLWDTTAGTEYFLQSQYDAFKDLRQRSLAGFGWRHEFWLISTTLAYGVGSMLEYEDLLSTGQTQLVVRSTNYISISMGEEVNFVGYFQPLWVRPSDFRVSVETQAKFPATKMLGFVLIVKYLYDTEPPLGVQEQDLSSTLSLRANW